MSTRSSLTGPIRRRITEDWKHSFPHLGSPKPMWLMKRNGPMMIGLCLDRTRSNDRYIPVSFVHCLIRPSSIITLTLYQALADSRVSRLRQEIPIDKHEASYEAYTERMKVQVPDLTLKEVTFSGLMDHYAEYFRERRDPAVCRYPSGLFADVILLSFWAGFEKEARRLLEDARAAMQTWPPHEIRPATWSSDIESLLKHREAIDQTVTSEIERHKLASVPSYPFNVDVFPSSTIIDEYRRA